MGVSSTPNRIAYAGDGSTVAFSFPYYFFAKADLFVFSYDTLLGGVTPKTINTDFTISGSVNAQGLYMSGGTVTYIVAPLSTDVVIIVRSPAQLQNFSLLQNGLISSAALVQQLDYLTLLCQRLQDEVSRCAIQSDGMGGTFTNTLPTKIALAASAGCTLVVNATNNGWDLGPTTGQITSAAANAATAVTSAAASAASAVASAGSAAAAAASAATGGVAVVTGSRSIPQQITAAGGIAFTGSAPNNVWFIKGNGGAVTVTRNPQIAAGSVVGQILWLFSTDDTNTVTLQDGTGLDLNGTWIGGNGGRLEIMWDGSNWSESSRR